MKTIPERLAWARERTQLSLRDFAEVVVKEGGYEITYATVLKYEKPDAKVPADYVAAVADAFDLRPAWLLTGSGSPDQPVGRRDAVDASNNTFDLLLESGEIKEVRISVTQETKHGMALTFGETELPFRSGIDHTFRAVIDGGLFSYEEEWEPVEAALKSLGAEKVASEAEWADAYELATCHVTQFPAYWKWEHNVSWQQYLEEVDEEADYAGLLLDLIENELTDHPIFSGSFLLIRALKVRQFARTFDVGAKLLGHALWRLHTEEGELAMALVDCENFTPDHPTSRAQERLLEIRSQLFERLGFQRVSPAVVRRAVSPLWTQIAAFYAILGEDIEGNANPLNYRGLGRLGRWRDSRSKGSSAESVLDSAIDEALEKED